MDNSRSKLPSKEGASGFENLRTSRIVVEEEKISQIETSQSCVGQNGAISSATSDLYLHGWKLGIVITSLTLGIFLIALDTTIIGVAIPKITSEFKNLNDIAWFGSAYLLTVTAFQPSFGTLYRFFNVKIVYIVSIVVFEVGSILCAASPSSPIFILGRAISGFGAAGIYQGALGIVGYTVVLEKRPLYFGIVVSSFAVSACVGPILGGALTDHVTWRWCFWINVPIGGVVLVIVLFFLKMKSQENATLPLKTKLKYVDGTGTVTFIGAICCLLLALQWGGQTMPWNSSKVVGLFAGFALLVCIFGLIQFKKGEYAIIPIRVMSQRSVAMSMGLLFFVLMGLTILSYYIPIYFQSVRGLSATTSGVRIIALIVPQMVFLMLGGIVATKWGYYTPYIIAGAMVCTIGCGLLTTIGLDTPTAIWATYEVIIGSGLGGSLQLPYTALQLVLDENDLPTGNALAVFASQLGGALGLSISQALLLTNLQTNIPRLVPSISPETIMRAGASNLDLLTADPEVLKAVRGGWADAVRVVFILAVVASALSIPFACGLEHLNVHVVAKKRKEANEEDQNRA
ncbi:Uncharacterized protein BP5553_02745 [Venustampulla echinocandica]|uniref:Major facilitator superfamily (MFS) profile domain-containing protein n=1 Tax=Venustampulla echinocandica TaxID=2656787 RepID=A0A370TS99_9HELO|nr:Uncharacterized protein BP5553_02745 [Venustampulla echinocandica]RDL38405.1 Uncharacterized protein BP5553_02745 [Venustampulla echinocandica]